MGIIACYARGEPSLLRRADHGAVCSADGVPGITVIDIDKAHEPLSWLSSPLARLENAYLARLIAEPDWPEPEIKARRAELNAMPIDDALAAIKGWSGEPITSDGSLVGALFAPVRVGELCRALNALSEQSLREELDFEVLDKALVPPDAWLENGEAVFVQHVLPSLLRLQDFYRAAAAAGEAVLVIYC